MNTATIQPSVSTDWQRIASSIKQRFRREWRFKERIPSVLERLKLIQAKVGEHSFGRRPLRNIGTSLVKNEGTIDIISPICLSIPPHGELSPGVAHLVGKHLNFLESFGDILPAWRLICLFPPPEKADERQQTYIQGSFEATRKFYAASEKASKVSIEMMADRVPGIICAEEQTIEEISASNILAPMSGRICAKRGPYYRELGLPYDLHMRKTRRTMAQYILLGRYASLIGGLMCNHGTQNIRCAVYAGGGVLHNPVGFKEVAP